MKSKLLDFKGRTYTVFEDGKIIVNIPVLVSMLSGG